MKDQPLAALEELLATTLPGTVEQRLHYPTASDHGRLGAHGTLTTTGRGLLEDYHLMHGVHFSHYYLLGSSARDEHSAGGTVACISHCRAGRLAWHMDGGHTLHLGPGDLSLHGTYHCHASTLELPLGYYEGVSIHIDLQVLSRHLPPALREAGLGYRQLFTLLASSDAPLYLADATTLDRLLAPIYTIDARYALPYLQLKVQELLLLLAASPHELTSTPIRSDSSETRIKEIHHLLTDDLSRRYTIEDLARRYHTNTTTLKAEFKSLYGAPIGTYMREYRIRRAIELLATGTPLSAIARAVGYASPSKFTAAFTAVTGELPSVYRRKLKSSPK